MRDLPQLVSMACDHGALKLLISGGWADEGRTITLDPNAGGDVMGWAKDGDRRTVMVAQNMREEQAEGYTRIVADWQVDISCDRFQVHELNGLWEMTLLMARYPLMNFLESFTVGERFVTLTLRKQNDTFRRVKFDKDKGGVLTWSEEGWLVLRRDLSRRFQHFQSDRALMVTARPHMRRSLLAAFGWAEPEDVRAVPSPQAAD